MIIIVTILAIATAVLLGIVFAALFKVASDTEDREWPIVKKIEEQTEKGLKERENDTEDADV